MYHLLLESVQEAKYFKNRRDIYSSAGKHILNSNPRDERIRNLGKYMKDHADLSHDAFKAHLNLLIHKRNAPRTDKEMFSGKGARYKTKQKNLEYALEQARKRFMTHKRNMIHFTKHFKLSRIHKDAVLKAKSEPLNKSKKTPKFQKGKGVFPGRGRTPKVKNEIGNIDNGCAVHSMIHATGRHPRHVLSAFTRQMDNPDEPWHPDGGASDLHMQRASRKLGYKMDEIHPKHLLRAGQYGLVHPIYTAGQLAKKHPKGNIIAISHHRRPLEDDEETHAFNIKNGKVHDAHGVANEDTPVMAAHHITKLPIPKRRK